MTFALPTGLELGGLPQDQLLPSVDAAISIIQKCRKERDLKQATRIHAHLHSNGLDQTGNYVVPMFVECGSVNDAHRVFRGLAHRNEISWTSLIQGYVHNGEPEISLDLFDEMQEACVEASKFTYMELIRACTTLKCVEKGREIHALVAFEGFETDQILGNTIIDMYAKCGWFSDASDVLYNLASRDVVSWSTLIKGYTEHGLGHQALSSYRQMQMEDISPNEVTFICVLKACAMLKDIDMVQELHTCIVEESYEIEAFVGNTLLDTYAKCGFFLEAKDVFDDLPVKDIVSWNALITGYVECGLNEECLSCVKEMQSQQSHSLDDVTFICSVKACGNLGAVEAGQHMHAQITKQGFEKDHFVGSSLVDMYAKCGLLVEAQFLFDCIPSRDAVLWNSLISGYADHNRINDMLRCLEQMRLEGISLDPTSFSCALNACGNIKNVEEGQKIHAKVALEELEIEPSISNSLLEMYLKCGLVEEAREVFNELTGQSTRSWNLLVAGYLENGYFEEVLDCVEQMELGGVPTTPYTYVCGLHACGSGSNVSSLQELHTRIIHQGLESHSYVRSALIDAYAKCGSLIEARSVFKGTSTEEVVSQSALVAAYAKCGALVEAQDLFDRLPIRTVVSWTSLIAGYADHGLGEKALGCFEQMQEDGVAPDAITYMCSLKACGSIGSDERLRSLHMSIIKDGVDSESSVCSMLVDMYAHFGLFHEAWDVFGDLPVESVSSWSALMSGYIRHGFAEGALSCLKYMQSEGPCPCSATVILGLKACICLQSLEEGRALHAQIAKSGFELDPLISSALVDMYSKCGSLCEAQKMFDGLLHRDVVSWNALISAYTDRGFSEKAAEHFKQMEAEGIYPNAIVFLSCLKGCSIGGTLEWGHELHAKIIREGFEDDPFIGGALVAMYTKSSSLEEAQDVFDELLVRDTVPWTALLAGYAEQGLSEEGLDLLDRMQFEGVVADSVTFLSTLKACGGIGNLDRGRAMHIDIVKKGLDADVSICNTLVDLYGRCGSISEARRVFEELPIPTIVSWNALIAGYARHGESEAVFRLYNRLRGQGISPTEATFLGILSMCSHGGLHEEAKAYFEAMVNEFGVIPTIKHYNCLLDLCGRAGQLDEVARTMNSMPCEPDLVTWKIVLDSCKKLGRIELGKQVFEKGLQASDRKHHAEMFVLMSNAYAAENLAEDGI